MIPGAELEEGGARFTLTLRGARAASVKVFAKDGAGEIPFRKVSGDLWEAFAKGVGAGDKYAFRVLGPEGFGMKPGRHLLLDPKARLILGDFTGEPSEDSVCGLLCALPDDRFDWEGDRHVSVRDDKTVLLETHVRGATRLMPGIPEKIRGTYLALATEAFISHVKALGATTICLMPVFSFVTEKRLLKLGLKNYWGYNTAGWFAPEAGYASVPENALTEIKTMVRALHKAGIEVILDVVYNHTAESDETGPTLCMREMDNARFYRVRGENGAFYENYTGCGNTVNTSDPAVLSLMMESLSYWADEIHADGFRFDLAASLLRGEGFLRAVSENTSLKGLKLIAEPWDIGPDGYSLGAFPAPWREWNDKFRDGARAFWLTRGAPVGALSTLLCGSSDVFKGSGRAPFASVNYVASHDGFTLEDLVSYEKKHNQANGEGGRDGADWNLSVNCGEEGPSKDPAVLKKRLLLKRALIATVLFSAGTPMLSFGDEFSRTQKGNNNAYCQDNEISWTRWMDGEGLTGFIARAAQIRKTLPQISSGAWRDGLERNGKRDVVWMNPDGSEKSSSDWGAGDVLCARLGLSGFPDLFLVFSRKEGGFSVTLPDGAWRKVFDSALFTPEGGREDLSGKSSLTGPTVAVFEAPDKKRVSGVLAHVTSLPAEGNADFGSGDFGGSASDFLVWLSEAGQKLWQVLPLTVTGEGNSPYMGASVFAGNELLVSPEILYGQGLLSSAEFKDHPDFGPGPVDFKKSAPLRTRLLRLAAERFFTSAADKAPYEEFTEKQAPWLTDYALFRAIFEKKAKDGVLCWQDWGSGLAQREPASLKAAQEALSGEIRFWKFAQWAFESQWENIRGRARSYGIRIIGDMPIYASPQSSDVWAHQALFELDGRGRPLFVAGVPPDYFSPTGQLWGNPLYRWEAHAGEDFQWWRERLKRMASLYDLVRVDHFRGFEAFWKIPAGKSALFGHWEKGPGRALFDAFKKDGAQVQFLAEDLGTITPEVEEMRRALGFPGMRVFQFGFDGDPANPHLPGNVPSQCAYYTGTHDNDTLAGWFQGLDQASGALARSVLSCGEDPREAAGKALGLVLASGARCALAPVQDIFGLPGRFRMNTPGDALGSWRFRLPEGLLDKEGALKLRALSEISGRNL